MIGTGVLFITFISVLMGIIQITIFKALPRWIKWICAYMPLLGMVINFMLSGVVLLFTGAGFFAGIGNLAGSVILGLYLVIYKVYHGLTMKTVKVWWIFKYPAVRARKAAETWYI